MISTGTLPLDAVVVGIALLAGYLVGSIPLTRLVARTPPNGAGPGWAMLALTGDLAKGVVPVAVGIVTWSWGIGWVAGLGALLGARWPAFGRYPGDRGVAVLGGVAFTLAPPAGVVSVLLAGLVLAAGKAMGRNALVPALATGFGAFPFLFLAVHQDLARVGALLVLYLVAGLRDFTTRGR